MKPLEMHQIFWSKIIAECDDHGVNPDIHSDAWNVALGLYNTLRYCL